MSLLEQSNDSILHVCTADSILLQSAAANRAVMLVLTRQALLIVNVDEDSVDKIFSLKDLVGAHHPSDPNMLRLTCGGGGGGLSSSTHVAPAAARSDQSATGGGASLTLAPTAAAAASLLPPQPQISNRLISPQTEQDDISHVSVSLMVFRQFFLTVR